MDMFAESGKSAASEIELNYRRYLVKVCAIIGMPFLAYYSIYDIIIGRYLVGGILFLMCSILPGLLIYLRRSTIDEQKDLVYRYFLIALFLLFGFYIVYAVGIEGQLSRIPWSFIFPVIVFFALGERTALVWVSILFLLLVLCGWHHSPREAIEVSELKTRFYISYVLVIIVSFFFERLKKKYQVDLIENQLILKESESRYRKAYLQLNNEMGERKRTEEALRLAEDKYRTLVENIRDGVFVIVDEKLRFVNEAFAKMLGYRVNEIIGADFQITMAPEDRAMVVERYRKRHSGENVPGEYEFRMLHKDGRTRVYVNINVWVAMYQGRVASIGTVKDITRRKQSEEALRYSEERFRELAELLPETIFEMDREGTLTFVNRKALDHFGYTQENFNNKVTAFDMLIPEDHHRAMENAEMIMKGEKIGLTEYTAQRKDGSTFPVMIHSSPISRHGKPVGLRGFMIDISDRKKIEESLLESEQKYRELYEKSSIAEEVYRSLLHSSPDAIVTYDLEGNVRYLSPAFTQIFGWTLEEVIGKRMPFLPDSEKQVTYEIIKNLHENGTPCQAFETKRLTKDGRMLNVSISASRYDDHQGKPSGFLVILRDMSERKRLESQLQQAQKVEAIGTLAGGIAHDFNNLMMGILGNINLMLCDLEENHPFFEKLRNIENQIQSGSKLTGQLLGYARKGKYEVRAINLNRLINETSETFGRTKKEITISKNLSEALFAIEADQGQIEQVLLNLYVNAADAMPNGGNLILKTENTTSSEMKDKPYHPKPGNYIILSVTDTGIGMDDDTMERIFDPFFTTKEMGRGTGLGLASVYGIIKAHGGYIDVESESGGGTTFHIYLPATDKTVTEDPKEPDVEIEEVSGTVLLIDDEEMVVDVGSKMLEKFGLTVVTEKNGNDAVTTFMDMKEKVDLVILDMVMPGMSGGETFDQLKNIDKNVKVLLSSGYSLDSQAKDIMDRGCDGFIQKPFNMNQLFLKVREVIA